MTPSQIADIRQMRGFNVSWHVIARRLQTAVAECRAAIGMQMYDKPTELDAIPWDQPTIGKTSDK